MYRGGEGIETWVRSQAWKGANNTISTAMVVKAFDEDLGEVVKLCQFEGINKRHAYSINAAIQQKSTESSGNAATGAKHESGYDGMAADSSTTSTASMIGKADLFNLVKQKLGLTNNVEQSARIVEK